MLLAILLALHQSAQDTVVVPYSVTIPRLEATVTLDGRLDEPVWRQAAVLDRFHQYQPVDSRPAEERTEVRIWYAPNAIYFGITAWDQAGGIRATVADRDNLDTDDRITIYLDTFNDRRRAFFFTVNPLGVQEDGVRSEGGFTAGSLQGGLTDKNPDYLWQSHGQVTDSGYVVEIRIPFKSLRYPGNGAQTWGLNVARVVQRTGYQDTWTDTRRANASFLLQAGSADGLHDLERGITAELQPFVTAQANGIRASSGRFERENLDPSAGANLRLGLASNLSLDATWNPDFSQIESDASLVTVNERFALFFPEKRPFFLEGIELFATPNQLVYTRQIVNPIAGGKVTAKLGRYNLANLVALDEAPGTDAFFTVTRVRRDIGANSTAGLTATSRDQDGGFNRLVAGDARIVFGKLYYVAGQLGGSWTRDATGSSTRSSPLWEAEFDRTGRSWGFNYKVTGIGEDFEAQSGFVPRNDIVQAHAFNRLSFYGGRGALVEQFTMFAGPTRLWRYQDFIRDALEGSESIDLQLTLRGGWRATGHAEHNLTDLRREDYAHYTVDRGAGPVAYRPLSGVDDGFATSFGVTTPTWQSANATGQIARERGVIFPEGSLGYETRLTGSLALRPTGSIRFTASQTYSRITRGRDGSEFARTIIPRLKLEYQPSRSLFFRVIGEYVSERRAQLLDARTGDPLLVDGAPVGSSESDRLRVDWLASFEPSPGTVAFFGYGSSLDDTNAFGFHRMQRSSDGFFVKLAYQIRR